MKIKVPPLKINGIKTKLVEFISENCDLRNDPTWVEPFMGSGVVGFNICPKKAIFADNNPYIINFYNSVKNRTITPSLVRNYLTNEGQILYEKDSEYYYEVRNRFNKQHNPLDFLFLNRTCYNGLMRFNKSGEFNTPYCKKKNRFTKSYVTKIVNQVSWVYDAIQNHDWIFLCLPFESTIKIAGENSFIYCDPPYIARHVNYYEGWNEEDEVRLHTLLMWSKSKFMVSTWDHNDTRKNPYIDTLWSDCVKTTVDHFYFVGGKEDNRRPIVEALLTNF